MTIAAPVTLSAMALFTSSVESSSHPLILIGRGRVDELHLEEDTCCLLGCNDASGMAASLSLVVTIIGSVSCDTEAGGALTYQYYAETIEYQTFDGKPLL